MSRIKSAHGSAIGNPLFFRLSLFHIIFTILVAHRALTHTLIECISSNPVLFTALDTDTDAVDRKMVRIECVNRVNTDDT